ncbi:nitrite reductase small subunit NirD [Pseudomonas sp. IC_126]|uniref:nitrite reductase small subunit NirD n=1 Tax=Pseudomonas sp. IC_126 TaxID=2547400 RepID=UPI001039DB7C|nr:nitrite reductase small subunit NirD [Pseudomonas sp. IC_126]TCD19114.1 nitrite reductase small subunit NirD [Pseudomonas sp. IC_126]
MSQPNAVRMQPSKSASWRALCSRRDLVANSGVVAWLDGEQVALFHLPETETGEQVFAIANKDPKSGANVIGRGILGQLKGDLVIASPLYKQHFRLADGSCLEYPEQHLQVWPVRLNGDAVEIAAA